MFHLTQKILRLQNQASDPSPLLLLKLQKWFPVFHKEIWSPSKQKYSIANITISIMFDCLTSPGDEYAGLADWSVVVVSVWPSLKKKHISMNICLLCCSIYIPICCCSCQDIKYNIPKSFIPVSHVSYPCLPSLSPMSPTPSLSPTWESQQCFCSWRSPSAQTASSSTCIDNNFISYIYICLNSHCH